MENTTLYSIAQIKDILIERSIALGKNGFEDIYTRLRYSSKTIESLIQTIKDRWLWCCENNMFTPAELNEWFTPEVLAEHTLFAWGTREGVFSV